MTCIVGLETPEGVFIGGDSAGSNGQLLHIRADEKVFHNGPFIMGFCGSFRMGQLLRYSLQLPEFQEDQDLMQFMCVDFINAVRTCLKEGGFAKNQAGNESGGLFLVGFKNRLFRVDSDYQVGLIADGYAAIGSGEGYALGALHALQYQDMAPEDKVYMALDAADEFTGSVSHPFLIVQE